MNHTDESTKEFVIVILIPDISEFACPREEANEYFIYLVNLIRVY